MFLYSANWTALFSVPQLILFLWESGAPFEMKLNEYTNNPKDHDPQPDISWDVALATNKTDDHGDLRAGEDVARDNPVVAAPPSATQRKGR